jgi:hypothetical protein
MAASVTHLVIGERVFAGAAYIGSSLEEYGAFLMGCILVDVHAFHPVDRRAAHLVGRVEEDGEAAYRSSCANFLQQKDRLLRRPWASLARGEQAFLAGYLCHLAVDECWKELGKNLFDRLGISDWIDFPIPGDLGLTVFDNLCFPRLVDPARAGAALAAAPIPDVFTHIAQEMLLSQWRIIDEYVFAGGTAAAHLDMLGKAGKPSESIQAASRYYAERWQEALDFTGRVIGGVEPFIAQATGRSLEVLPGLYHSPSVSAESE